MKKSKLLICAALLSATAFVLLTLGGCTFRKKLDEPINFIIATDLHYISPSLLGDGSFFEPTADRRNDGKTIRYVSFLTDALLEEVTEKKPQALILSGDLTLNGAKASHEELVKKLLSVKEKGIDVLVIPGNHDVDQTAVSYSGDTPTEAEGTSSSDFANMYECLRPEKTVSRDDTSLSYIYQAADKLWIVMLDTNFHGQCYVKESTLDWLEAQLRVAKKEKIDVISVTHQNIYEHSELLSFGYQLYNHAELLELYEEYSVQCNFSGHIHIQSVAGDKVPEIATSSVSVTGLHYGKINYDGRGIEYSTQAVNTDAYAESIGSSDENLLSFSDYATYYFEEVARVQARALFEGSGMSVEKIELLADTYARINSAYFEGKKINESEHREGLALWREQGDSFMLRYIESMLDHGKGDKRQLSVKFK